MFPAIQEMYPACFLNQTAIPGHVQTYQHTQGYFSLGPLFIFLVYYQFSLITILYRNWLVQEVMVH